MYLHHAAGKILNDIGRYDEAFDISRPARSPPDMASTSKPTAAGSIR